MKTYSNLSLVELGSGREAEGTLQANPGHGDRVGE